MLNIGGEQRRPEAPGDRRGEHRSQEHERDALNRDELFEQQADAKSAAPRPRRCRDNARTGSARPRAGLNRFRRNGFAVFGRDDMDADRAGLAHEFVDDRAVHHLEPSGAVGFADDDLRDVVRRCISDDLFGDVAARDRDRRGTEPLGEPQKVGDAVALGIVEALRPRRLDIDRRPRGLQTIGNASRIADQPAVLGASLMQTSTRSPAGQGPAMACARMCDSSCSSTRWAVRRNASSRSAVRLPVEK